MILLVVEMLVKYFLLSFRQKRRCLFANTGRLISLYFHELINALSLFVFSCQWSASISWITSPLKGMIILLHHAPRVKGFLISGKLLRQKKPPETLVDFQFLSIRSAEQDLCVKHEEGLYPFPHPCQGKSGNL